MTTSNDPPKSCLTCPSMLLPADVTKFFGRAIGPTPICAVFGKPIHLPKDTANQASNTAQKIAKNCSHYGKPRPSAPDYNLANFRVAMMDPEIIRYNEKRSQEAVATCASCEHQVRADVVLNEVGFLTPMCAARGELIPPHRQAYKGRVCPDRSLATNGVRTHLDGVTMLPEYIDSGAPGVAANVTARADDVDPVDYETDREVTPENWESGIRAWRKIVDGATLNETYLPIYRRDLFDEAEQAKIPSTGDSEHPEDYIDHGFYVYKIAVLWRELDETPGVWGEAGTGKTELFRHLAWLMQLPFERVSITGSTQIDDIAGTMRYDPERGTYWQDGRLVAAWSKPCVLVLDEPNTGPPDVWQFVRPMTDNSKQLVLDQANDATPRTRNDNCYLGLAMNPAWDMRNVGTHVVGDADVNRLMHISIPRPPEKLEREIIAKRCAHDNYDISRKTLDLMMKIAKDIRGMADDSTIPITWATRPQLKVARSSRWFDLKTCYRMAVADFLEPEQARQVLDIVESYVS